MSDKTAALDVCKNADCWVRCTSERQLLINYQHRSVLEENYSRSLATVATPYVLPVWISSERSQKGVPYVRYSLMFSQFTNRSASLIDYQFLPVHQNIKKQILILTPRNDIWAVFCARTRDSKKVNNTATINYFLYLLSYTAGTEIVFFCAWFHCLKKLRRLK